MGAPGHCIGHIASALGGVPFVVVRGPLELFRALHAPPRGDLRSVLWHERLGPRLARCRISSRLVSRQGWSEKNIRDMYMHGFIRLFPSFLLHEP